MNKKNLFLLYLLCTLVSNAQNLSILDTIQYNINNQLVLFPQEKIHLHTDRALYVAGDSIWFKAYVVDAYSNQFSTYSQYVYAELINSSDSLVHRVMISRDEFGLFHGNICLSTEISAGNYTLRAYTRYMENLGDDYFYKKNIRIANLQKKDTRQKRRQPRPDYDVSFFPEGGNLIEGAQNRIAFKALNQQGASEMITGQIVDNEGQTITEVSSFFAGMGSFALFPELGKEYFLVSISSSERKKRFKLPAAQKNYTIHTIFRNSHHFIQVKKSPNIPERPLYLLIHCKGNVLYYASWDHQNDYVILPGEQCPSGVLQIVLFDEQRNPVSERLVFNKIRDQVNLVFSLDKTFYGIREKITPEILLVDMDENPLEGNFSIAITDDNDIAIDSLYTIESSLLLSSELKGYIESPGYYLQDHKHAINALDHLMMTHGWRRYELSEAIKGNYNRPETGYEITKEISGSVRGLFRRPVANGKVILVSNEQSFMQAEADDNGEFHFDLHYPDSTQFFILAKNEKEKENVEIVLKPEKFPELKHAPVSFSLLPANMTCESQLIEVPTAAFFQKATQRTQYDKNIRVIKLDEVIVVAKRIDKRDEERLKYAINIGSDYTLYREKINRFMSNQVYITPLLSLIPGVKTTPGYTGNPNDDIISLFYGAPPPLIYIDGMPMPGMEEAGISPLEGLYAFNIESIDVKRFSAASFAGVRGAGGIISITTRKDYSSHELKRNTDVITPLGYQKPVEFYAPKYDTSESKNQTIPDVRTTIFWKPDVIVSNDGKSSFEFYTSDFPTTYSVVIEGLTEDGKLVRQIEKIQVQ